MFKNSRQIPIPSNFDEFERLCLLVARERYGAHYYRYGRRGQKQFGIDIYSAYHDGRFLQCKLHDEKVTDAKLSAELEKDLGEAKTKFSGLKEFIFVVSVDSRPGLQDLCRNLSNKKMKVIPWFWNQIQEDISRSKWLLRYCLDIEPGGQWISKHFIDQEKTKGDALRWEPIQFYTSNTHMQWYGVAKKWDAPRTNYPDICSSITDSFDDLYIDMPVAAVVTGEGGSGKSILLRRIALELKDKFTIYWIEDNISDFLSNEWSYDIDRNPNENYLLIIEDWYRNVLRIDDSRAASSLIQKTRKKTNVRLLIGDRMSSPHSYPKPKGAVYQLCAGENEDLMTHIIGLIPEWVDKFSGEQVNQLSKLGLFQMLFVYQYAESNQVTPKALNYFHELVQSDFKRLYQRESKFYKGLSKAIQFYGNIYTRFAITLTPESVVTCAEYYSQSDRSYSLQAGAERLLLDPIIKRYFGLSILGKMRFLHDTLADEGWSQLEDIPKSSSEVIVVVK